MKYFSTLQRSQCTRFFCIGFVGLLILAGCSTLKPPQIARFEATPTTIQKGESSTLQWSIENTEQTRISISGIGAIAPGVQSSRISPDETTTYTLQVERDGKMLAERTATVNVVQPPQIVEFEAQPASIKQGETSTLRWTVRNDKGVKISIKGVGTIPENSNSVRVTPDQTTSFTLQVERDNKVIAEKSVSVTVAPAYKPPVYVYKPDSVSVGPNDGRFTIGMDDKRLMYGYPIPFSTSHFVVKINGKLASNAPHFRNDVRYITGTVIEKGPRFSMFSDITYHFAGANITQKLVPVDQNFQDVAVGKPGYHYRIEYTIENVSGKPMSAGLMALFDTMIDDNDSSRIYVGAKQLRTETTFQGASLVPKTLTIWQRPNDRKLLYADFNTDKGKAVRPDVLYVGNWPYFHNCSWDINTNDQPYFDSAVLMKWLEETIPANGSRFVATHYGNSERPMIGALSNTPIATFNRNILFAPGSSGVSAALLKELKEYIKDKKVVGALVNAYADAVGSEKINLAITRQRANKMKDALAGIGIDRRSIIPKAFGELQADQSPESQKKGRKEDRRGDIIILVGQ